MRNAENIKYRGRNLIGGIEKKELIGGALGLQSEAGEKVDGRW